MSTTPSTTAALQSPKPISIIAQFCPLGIAAHRSSRRIPMIGRAGFPSKYWRVLRWAGLAAAAPALWACTSRTLEMPNITPTATLTTNFTQKINNEIDILFMIDNSSSMTEMQQKLYDQLPVFMNVLQKLPTPPSLHVAVVSSDMGAPGDSTGSIMCSKVGDQGQFQSMPRGNCAATTITAGDNFISDADMDAELHRPDRERLPVHRAPRRQGLRLREPAGVDRSRARRRRTAAEHERGLPAARGLPRHRHPRPTRTTARPPPTPSSTR